MSKTRVFVSSDFNNDKALKDFILSQAKNPDSPFEISGHSIKKTEPEKDWIKRTERAIARADVFIIMLGSRTKWDSGVLKELKIADEKGKKKFQIIGYSDGREDWAVKDGGRVYKWDWENLKKLLS